MDYEQFVDRLEERTELWSRDKTEDVAKTTVEVLGETLSTEERTWLAERLPEPLGDALTRTWGGQDIDIAEFKDRLSHREGLVEDFAAEQAQIVCAVLGEELDAEVVNYLRRHLPGEFAAWFAEPV